MVILPKLVFLIFAFLTAAVSPVSGADDRSALTLCQAVMARAAQAAQDKSAAGGVKDDAEIQRCRIVVREWTLRDSRMLVDEQGRPLR